MLRKRVIVGIDIRDGRAVSRHQAEGTRDLGNPVEHAVRYEAEGADEIIFLDISPSGASSTNLLDAVTRAADALKIPLTVAAAHAEVDDIGRTLRAGADRVSINTAAVQRPELISDAVQEFGRQCIVAGIDARAERRQIEILARPDGSPAETGAAAPKSWYRVFTHGGATATQMDAIAWARQCVELGAGELLITNIDHDGARAGYDLELTARIVESVSAPVIASGGARSAENVRDAFLLAGADAAMIGAPFDSGATVGTIKRVLISSGIPVRDAKQQELLQ